MDFAGDLDAFYADFGEPVTPAVGQAFVGLFAEITVELFEWAGAGDYQLQYIASRAILTPGADLTLKGRQFRVASVPRAIGDGLERVVALAEVAP